MSRSALVLLDRDRALLANKVAFRGKPRGKAGPRVGVASTGRSMLDFGVESLERFNITITDHPGHGSPWATIQRFEDPELALFEAR
jgi:hypothetical protein